MLRPMVIAGLTVDPLTNSPIVILKDACGKHHKVSAGIHHLITGFDRAGRNLRIAILEVENLLNEDGLITIFDKVNGTIIDRGQYAPGS